MLVVSVGGGWFGMVVVVWECRRWLGPLWVFAVGCVVGVLCYELGVDVGCSV